MACNTAYTSLNWMSLKWNQWKHLIENHLSPNMPPRPFMPLASVYTCSEGHHWLQPFHECVTIRTTQAVLIGPDHTRPCPIGLPCHTPGCSQDPCHEEIPMSQRLQALYSVMWPLCDDCTTTHLAGHLVSRPGT